MTDKEIIKVALDMVEFGLEYNVDYINLLEAIKKVLEGNQVKFKKEDYLDF